MHLKNLGRQAALSTAMCLSVAGCVSGPNFIDNRQSATFADARHQLHALAPEISRRLDAAPSSDSGILAVFDEATRKLEVKGTGPSAQAIASGFASSDALCGNNKAASTAVFIARWQLAIPNTYYPCQQLYSAAAKAAEVSRSITQLIVTKNRSDKAMAQIQADSEELQKAMILGLKLDVYQQAMLDSLWSSSSAFRADIGKLSEAQKSEAGAAANQAKAVNGLLNDINNKLNVASGAGKH